MHHNPIGLISVDGQVTQISEGVIPCSDRGFLFGDALFETILCLHGQFIDLQWHVERLAKAATQINFPFPWNLEQISSEMTALVKNITADKITLRLVITRGSGFSIIPQNTPPRKVIYAFPSAQMSAHLSGIQLLSFKSSTPQSHLKVPQYLHSIVALQRAQELGYQDVLFLNQEGHITEATTANIFLSAKRGNDIEIVTPALSCGLLPGITRRRLLAILKEACIQVHERPIFADEIPTFDEAFLSSSIRGLTAVQRIDDHLFHTTRRNSSYHKISSLYDRWILGELKRDPLSWKLDWTSGRLSSLI